ncbi:hypothetical protein SLS55_003523 [Diplodia seriata]|uniref:Uncharacterized protein n=1 Tax=Diplodia seriata TaxID=420778 RepID=A0ABR3CN98_9PEZI
MDWDDMIDWDEWENDPRPEYINPAVLSIVHDGPSETNEQPAGELCVPDPMTVESTYQPINPERNYVDERNYGELWVPDMMTFESTYQPINPERNYASAFVPCAFDPSLDPTFEPLDGIPESYHDPRAFDHSIDPSWEPADVNHESPFYNHWVEPPRPSWSPITVHTPSPPPSPAVPLCPHGVPTTNSQDECNACGLHARTLACKAMWDLLERMTDPAPPRAHVKAARATYFRARADEQNHLDNSFIHDDDGAIEAGIVVAHSHVWDWHLRRLQPPKPQPPKPQPPKPTVTFADDVQDTLGRSAEAFGLSSESYVPGRWKGEWLDTSGMKVPFCVFYADEIEDGSEDDSEDDSEDNSEDNSEDEPEVDAKADVKGKAFEVELEVETTADVKGKDKVKAKVSASRPRRSKRLAANGTGATRRSKRLETQKHSKKE